MSVDQEPGRHGVPASAEPASGARPSDGSASARQGGVRVDSGTPHVALVTTFYPNRADPTRAVFVENLARELRHECRLHIVSPVPFAPPTARWAAWRNIPRLDRRHGLCILHPRFLVLPRLEVFNALSYALGVLPLLARLARRHPGLIVHAHCAYPDAVGAALVARVLGLRYVVTAHGSDLNVYSHRTLLRPQIRWGLRNADAVIAVSRALRRRALELMGAQAEPRCHHVACAAVDPALFHAGGDAAPLRGALGVPAGARVVVFVGKLVPIKGVDTLIAAWVALLAQRLVHENDRLIIIGSGPQEALLRGAARGAGETVRFLGAMPQAHLAQWIRAADLLCLPSRNEGTPNVVIEALASGTPVVASAVGAVPDFVRDGQTGFLARPDDAPDLGRALARGLSQRWDRAAIAATVQGHTWRNIAQANARILRNLARGMPDA